MSELKKPRICEVIGVDPGEEWKTNNNKGSYTYRITDFGELQILHDGKWVVAYNFHIIIDIINGKAEIIHKPHWTAEEKRQAEAVKTLYPWAIYVQKDDAAPSIFVYDNNDTVVNLYDEEERLFPNLKDGKAITLDEILEVQK